MTTLEMNIEFLRLLKTINNELVISELPDTETILEMLNISQIRYLKEVYLKDGNHSIVLDKTDELRDLIRRELINCTRIEDNGPLHQIAYSVDLSSLSDEFMFYVRSDSKVTRTDIHTCTTKWFPNEYIKYSEKEKFLTTPVNNPIITKPGCYIENDGSGNVLVIIHDSFTTLTTTSGVNIEYMKEPVDMSLSQNSELPNYMHEDIVRFAVNMYISEYKFKLSAKNNETN